MAFGAELIARLGLDTTAFSRGLAQAQNSAGQLGKALDRKIGQGDAFKGLVAGLGISIENIAEKIAEAWVGGTREGLKNIESLYDQEAALIQKNIFDRLPDEAAKKAFIDKEIAKQTAELNRPRGTATSATGFNPYTGKATTSTVFTESQEDYDTRQAQARVRIAELQGVQIGQQNKKKEESTNLDKQLEEAQQRRLMSDADAAEKVAILSGKKAAAEMAVENAAAGSNDQKRAQVELEKVSTQLIEAQQKLQEEIQKTKEENLRLSEKQAEKEKRIRDIQKAEAGAVGAVAAAKSGLATARRDALSVSIQDAAAGNGVTQTNKAAARRILGLEAQAKRVMQSGSTSMRDYNGNLMSASDYAGQIQSRADALRSKAGFLTSSEQNPFASAQNAIETSEKHLKDIRDSLKEEQAKK